MSEPGAAGLIGDAELNRGLDLCRHCGTTRRAHSTGPWSDRSPRFRVCHRVLAHFEPGNTLEEHFAHWGRGDDLPELIRDYETAVAKERVALDAAHEIFEARIRRQSYKPPSLGTRSEL